MRPTSTFRADSGQRPLSGNRLLFSRKTIAKLTSVGDVAHMQGCPIRMGLHIASPNESCRPSGATVTTDGLPLPL
ncbi:hypothetical protein PAXRUDRAFT_831514 [Paxillus rubicundulus Ve08.2h10]|uniref:Uncharacterized protein n=1 Tax=Paxillus rubicundulus Ve08.2h10 TaxID=930991 RepID=A0A0D0DWT3_9AGAM|nr:hypothetical protein PAXRUDRAFT_831514 [Paxillus rubicundulus Ve08.2h10]